MDQFGGGTTLVLSVSEGRPSSPRFFARGRGGISGGDLTVALLLIGVSSECRGAWERSGFFIIIVGAASSLGSRLQLLVCKSLQVLVGSERGSEVLG